MYISAFDHQKSMARLLSRIPYQTLRPQTWWSIMILMIVSSNVDYFQT